MFEFVGNLTVRSLTAKYMLIKESPSANVCIPGAMTIASEFFWLLRSLPPEESVRDLFFFGDNCWLPLSVWLIAGDAGQKADE